MKQLLILCVIVLAGFQQASFASERCEIYIQANDALTFDVDEIRVPMSCQQFTVHLEHTGRLPKVATGHNWILTEQSDLERVARDGFRAGPDNEWLKPDDERVLASIPILGRGESAAVTFDVDALDPDTLYGFLCTVGGHAPRMRGSLKVISKTAE